MVWVKIDDGLVDSKKWRAASAEAAKLWITALCWANHFHTDGRLTDETLSILALKTRIDPTSVAAELVDLRLWEPYQPEDGEADDGDGGYWIHDYAEYQPTRDKLARQRELKRQRQARWRAGANQGHPQHTPGPGGPSTPPTTEDASRDAAVVASTPVSNGSARGDGLYLPPRPRAGRTTRGSCDPIDLEELRQVRRIV